MMNNLHKDIVLNILVRLPVKSIGRCRCVSKYWCRLLTDSRFVKMHLNHVLGLKKLCLVLSSYSKFLKDIRMLRYDPLSSTAGGLVTLKDPVKSKRVTHEMEVLGYCHGLVCVRVWMLMDQVFLWNPCTREYKKLPLLRHVESSNDITYIKYGFGYDCKMDDYKVVSFVGYKDERGCEVQMYTLGSNSWRRMNHIPYDLSCDTCVCPQVLVNGSHQQTFNGAIHWIAGVDSVGAHASKVVISFNFEKEIFKEIPLPMLFDEKFRPKLRVVGGNLCYLDLKPEAGFEVWKMMDYGGRTSWNKIFTYSKQQLVSPIENCTPLQVLKNGEILSLVRTDVTSHFVLHDPERDISRIPEIKELEAHYVSSSVFVESLEPLNSQTYVGCAEKEDSENVVGLGNNKYLKEIMIIFAIFLLAWFLNDFLSRVL